MKSRIFPKLIIGICCLHGYFLNAQISEKYYENWNNSEVQHRITEGIKTNRMGNFSVIFVDEKGKSAENVDVKINQISHDFYFGANGFMLQGFKDPKENALYEKYFTQLFNFMTVPFYWPELEPEPGKLRFGKESEYIYRRPAPDVVLDFCKKKNITPKGHTLVWDNLQWALPNWLEKDEKIMEQKFDKRIDEIAERYRNEISIWDVANEVTDRHTDVLMPKDFAFKAFKESERVFPGSTLFTLNFTTAIWYRANKREYSADYLLIDNLICRNTKLDVIGMQFHNFNENEYWRILKGELLTPEVMFNTLDLYSDFNLPIHITEITLAGLSDKGEEYQATMTENYYKLWFSHPKVEAIIWWNMVDGTAAPAGINPDGSIIPGEDKWKGGLLRRDFSEKPSYKVLDRLINHEWKTNLSVQSMNNQISYNGFYGRYKLTVNWNGKTYEEMVNFPKKGIKKQVIILK